MNNILVKITDESYENILETKEQNLETQTEEITAKYEEPNIENNFLYAIGIIIATAMTGAVFAVIIFIFMKIANISKNKKLEQERFEEKYKEYSDFDTKNSGNAWDYENARTYANMGNDFKNHNESDYTKRDDYNNDYNNSSYNSNNNSHNYSSNSANSSTGNDFYTMFSSLTPDLAKNMHINLVKKYHSDNTNADADSEEIIKEINEAYDRYKKDCKK